MRQETKINKERIGVLIGKEGSVKAQIEEQTQTKITVDSNGGLILVEGEDADLFIRAVATIQAISRGFSPERAFVLLEEDDLYIEVIDISDAASTPDQMERLRGRIIGRNGRARGQIEDMTQTSISVYGKTVSVIGDVEQIRVALDAIDMLVSGVEHETVFSFLEKKRREAKQNMISYYY
ncbi:MAG: KH domain-containing protein [Methanomicrobiales archaeon]|jgi:ribosomal RNA assembly protein|nr:KH domain-containing protein [Methanomicrobiales archaeon]